MSVSGPTSTQPSTSTPATTSAASEPVPPAEASADAGAGTETSSGHTPPPASAPSGPQMDPTFFQNSLKTVKSYDTDNDGMLNKAEYDALASKSSGAKMASFDAIPDTAKTDGKVSFDLAATAHAHSNDLAQYSHQALSEATAEYKRFDKDGSGTLDQKEFKAFATAYGFKDTDYDKIAGGATVGKSDKTGKAQLTQSDGVLAILDKRSPVFNNTLSDLATKLAESPAADRPKIVSDAQAQLRGLAQSAPPEAAEFKHKMLATADLLGAIPGTMTETSPDKLQYLQALAAAYVGSGYEVSKATGQPATPQSAFDKLKADNEGDKGWDEGEALSVAKTVERAKAAGGAPAQSDEAGMAAFAQKAVEKAVKRQDAWDAIANAMTGGGAAPGGSASPAPSSSTAPTSVSSSAAPPSPPTWKVI